MIYVRKKQITFEINLKEVIHNVNVSMKGCGIINKNKNVILLTFLFLDAQLYNQFASNNELEPINLKQLNNINIWRNSKKSGGSYYKANNGNNEYNGVSSKKKKRKKRKKRKRRTKRKRGIIQPNINQMFRGIVSKLKFGVTLLMIILSLGNVDAQVSSVGISFDEFAGVIHNTAGIGDTPLTFKKQHELTYNYGQLANKDPTHISGYCSTMSAVSSGFLADEELKNLLMKTGVFQKSTKEAAEAASAAKLLSNNTNPQWIPDGTTSKIIIHPEMPYPFPIEASLNSGWPALRPKDILTLQHPGSMIGSYIAEETSKTLVSTIFGIDNSSSNKDKDLQEMIDIVHKTLVQDRKFAIEKGLLKKTDVSSAIIVYPHHAMTVNVLESGALVIRNADTLGKADPIDWLTYKPPLN